MLVDTPWFPDYMHARSERSRAAFSIMEIPAYLRILWNYKWLLLVGMIIAAGTGILAGFTVGPDGLTSKSIRSYAATTTLLVTSANDTNYQVEVPARPIPEGFTAPQSIDLSNTAVIYAYLISGSNLQSTVVERVRGMDREVESISALRRTTQPAGNERFPGNLRLPLLDVTAVSTSPERAELLASVTVDVFLEHVKAEQDKRKLKNADRVQIYVTNVGPAIMLEGSNPYTPVVFTAGGIFLGFIILAFSLHGWRTARRASASAQRDIPPAEDESDSPRQDEHAT